jgi:hypothetical protein
VTTQDLNFQVKKDNLVNSGTVEIIEKYAYQCRDLEEFRYWPLKEQVDKINDHKEKIRAK